MSLICSTFKTTNNSKCLQDVLGEQSYLQYSVLLSDREKTFFEQICILSCKDVNILKPLLNDCIQQKKNSDYNNIHS